MDGSNPRNGRPGRDERIQVMDWDMLENELDVKIKLTQQQHKDKIENWARAFKQITLANGKYYYHGNALVVVVDNELRRGVTFLFHETLYLFVHSPLGST